MNQVPSNRFFTPPKVPAVCLRLRTLMGGGACPSQFQGHTPDGREVYIRYRGGYLSIRVAPSPEQPVLKGEKLLDLRIGPAWDGEISAQQLIALTGLEVENLKAADVSAHARERDLSGATSFWDASGISATKEGVEAFLSNLRRSFPDCQVIAVSCSPNGDCNRRVMKPGETPRHCDLDIRLGPGCPAVTLRFAGYYFDDLDRGQRTRHAGFSEQAGRAIELAGIAEGGVPFSALDLSSEFPTGNAEARAWLLRLDAELDSHFPEVSYAPHDVASGQAMDGEPFKAHDDPEIRRWVASADSRFRRITRQGRDAPLIGYR